MSDTSARLSAALHDRYRIERELGSGGMATVYLAEDLRHSRKVAIKVLREDLAASMGANRFLREIQIAAQLQHPNILPLLDSGEADGLLYFVMPYVPGQSLRERLAREGELPVHEAVRLLCEITDALAHSHAMGVVHRDVKPDNVMMSGRHALVTDFGVAKAISEATGRNTVTTLGVALGTPTYMSPEQAAADPNIDHRSDIYAVGVMAYEMLTGRPPFTGATPQQVLAAHVTEIPDSVTRRRPAISPALAEIVMRCLAKRPADRYQSAEELLHLLEAQATPSTGVTPTQTRPTTAWSAPANRRAWVLPVTVAVVTALVATIWMRTGRNAAPPPIEARRTQVTFTGTADFAAALSPNGQQVAFADRRCNAEYICTYDLVVQDIGGQGSARIVEGMAAIYELKWTGDGRTILMGGLRAGEQVAFYAVPALGGQAPRLISSSPVRLFGTADSALIGVVRGGDTLVIRATTLASPLRGDTTIIVQRDIGAFDWGVSGLGTWVIVGDTRDGLDRATIYDRTGRERSSFEDGDVRGGGFLDDRRLIIALQDSAAPGTMRIEERDVDAGGRLRGPARLIASGVPLTAFTVTPGGITYLAGTVQSAVVALSREEGAGAMRTREVTTSTGFLSSLMGSDGTYIILQRRDPSTRDAVRFSVQPFEGGPERPIGNAQVHISAARSRTVDGRGLVVASRTGDAITITELDLATGRSTPRGTMPATEGELDGFEAMADGSLAWQGEGERSEVRVRTPTGEFRSIRTPQVVTAGMEDSPYGHGLLAWGFSLPNFDTLVVYHVPPGGTEGRSLMRAVFDYLPGHRWLPDGNAELLINETLSTSAFYHLDVTTGALRREGTLPLNFVDAISFSNDGRRIAVRTEVPTQDVWILRWD